MPKQNLHTHSRFDDGADTPADMAEAAVNLGFDSLGFSGHSPIAWDDSTMSEESMKQWMEEVAQVRKDYAGKLDVFLGLELDSFSRPVEGLDYVIGSVHMLEIEGKQIPIDLSRTVFVEQVVPAFASVKDLVKTYYQSVKEMLQQRAPDICGHLDLIGKYNEHEDYYSFSDPELLDAAMDAVFAGIDNDVLFEINTGAMARGYRSEPYPALPLLIRMQQAGAKFVLSSDCHQKEMLDYGFAQAIAYARAAGIGELGVLERHDGELKFRFYPLEAFDTMPQKEE